MMNCTRRKFISCAFVSGAALIFFGLTVYSFFNKKIILPYPEGNFAVGATRIHLVDVSRHERHDPSTHRQLMVQAYYPIEKKDYQSKKGDRYLKYSAKYVKQSLADMKNISINQLDYVDDLFSYSYENASISEQKQHYPVVIFIPGFGAPQETYTVYLEELASQGFIVLGINFPYVSNPTIFPDGKVIMQSSLFNGSRASEEKEKEFIVWLEDIRFVLDELTKLNAEHAILRNKCDLERIGAMGHSFGGRIVIEACRKDNRIKAGLDLDGKLSANTSLAGFDTPLMFIIAERKDDKERDRIEQLQKNMTGDTFLVVIKGADHGTFTDLNLVFKQWLYQNKIDPTRGIREVRSLVEAFFNVYLKNGSKSLLTSRGIERSV